MSLVEVDRYFTTVEAEVYRMLLNSHGIDAVLFDTGFNNAEGGGMATATRLMVLAGDRDDALLSSPTIALVAKQMRDRANVETSTFNAAFNLVARDPVLAPRHCPGQCAAIA